MDRYSRRRSESLQDPNDMLEIYTLSHGVVALDYLDRWKQTLVES